MESCLLKVTLPIILSALEAIDVTSSHLPLPHVRHPVHDNVQDLLPLGHSFTEPHSTSSSQRWLWRLKHSRLLRELQELREELLELAVGNVDKDVEKGNRRISNMEEGSVKVIDGDGGKSNRRKALVGEDEVEIGKSCSPPLNRETEQDSGLKLIRPGVASMSPHKDVNHGMVRWNLEKRT